MRFALGALLLAACNQVFGLSQTASEPPFDAAYFDAPTDAPFACPPTGETPQFSRQLNQIVQHCTEYTASTTGRATALCYEPANQLAEGPINDELMPLAGLEQTQELHIDLVRYAPEGDELILRVWQQSSLIGRIVVYRKLGTTFTAAYDVTLPSQTTDSFVRFGAPSRGPRRRMLVRNTGSNYQEIEFDSTGAATLIGTYTASDLGATVIGLPPNMSADGLRIVLYGASVSGESGTLYTDRASLADRFTPVQVIENVPNNATPFMTEDCGRLYLTALNYTFWVQRR